MSRSECAKCEKEGTHSFTFVGYGADSAVTLYYCDDHIKEVYEPPVSSGKGEPEGVVARMEKGADGHLMIVLPPTVVEELDWREGDKIDIDTTRGCFDWGIVPEITLRNLSKEMKNED